MVLTMSSKPPFLEPCSVYGSVLARCIPQHGKAIVSRFNVAGFSMSLFSEYNLILPDSMLNAVVKRQAEYLAGRILTKKLFTHFKRYHEQLLIGDARQPLWPKGLVGSISHTESLVLAIVGVVGKTTLIGCDVESIIEADLIDDIKSTILVEDEIKLLETLDFTKQEMFTLIFSAKESLYKALYPSVGQFFDFQAAKVTHIDKLQNTITLALTHDLNSFLCKNQEFTLRFEFIYQQVITVLYID
jgi:enterobactin synthetase component D